MVEGKGQQNMCLSYDSLARRFGSPSMWIRHKFERRWQMCLRKTKRQSIAFVMALLHSPVQCQCRAMQRIGGSDVCLNNADHWSSPKRIPETENGRSHSAAKYSGSGWAPLSSFPILAAIYIMYICDGN